MKNILILLMIGMYSSHSKANYLDEHVEKKNWNGIDVIWLEDSTLPTYDVTFYFGEGALGDPAGVEGVTEITLNQLTSGTKTLNQRQIIEQLEFFGAGYGSSVTHEFADFSVSGLVKDFKPTMKLVCSLFKEATFPEKELEVLKTRVLSSIRSMVTNHGALANHVFRAESLKGSGYSTSVQGNIKSLKAISSKDLKARLNELNESVKKRVYVKGPKNVLALESILEKDCGWSGSGKKRTYPKVEKVVAKKELIFVPVKGANQAQVRIGRVMTTSEVKNENDELTSFAAKFMGGGFTSRLVQGLRVEKGLTYSAGAYASGQSAYGRSGISTFTKNETIVELLDSIKEIVESSSKKIDKRLFQRAKKNIQGNYLLGLESTSDFLKNLMFYDHKGKDFDKIYEFSDIIKDIERNELKKMISDLYGWDKQTVLVLGDPSLVKVLEKGNYKVKTVDFEDYL